VKRKSNVIGIFSKSADFGTVKTRLRPLLSDEQCLSFHLALLQDTITKCRITGIETRLFLSGSQFLPFHPQMLVRPQQGLDLGERLSHAFAVLLEEFDQAVIIGTDSPMIEPQRLQDGFTLLDKHDVVLGPSHDGGYYLIGLRKLLPEIFSGIPWSTPDVFQQTISKIRNHLVALLDHSYDVDEPADFERLRNEVAENDSPYLVQTREWFRNYSAK